MALHTYYYAQNHNNIAGLAQLSVQPQSSLIRFPETIYTLDGNAQDNGVPSFTWIIYNVTYEAMGVLFTELGLSMSAFTPVKTVQGTVWTVVGEDYQGSPLAGFFNVTLERPDLNGANWVYPRTELVFKIDGEAS